MAAAPTTELDAGDVQTIRRRLRIEHDHPHYKWVALSNTTLGMLMVTINSSIVIISLPDIFRGIDLNPLAAGNVSYLLWMMMGFLLASAVLVVMFGRLGDIVGRVKIYNYGFVVFTIAAVALSFDPFTHGSGAVWLIGWRVFQGIGGAMLMANAAAILTDAFPAEQRGFALGINQVAAVAGSFLGLLLGGLLAQWDWKAVFWVSVPFGILGTVWSYRSLHDNGQRNPGSLDIPGTITFAVGLTALLTGITYGIQPYGDSTTGWSNPWVLAGVFGGIAVLGLFCWIETKVEQPMFHLSLLKNRAFGLGNLAGLMSSLGRGGLQFMLIIWLQGIWLPLHGYDYESTPLWAGIYLLPLTVGFLIAGPVSGKLSDLYGPRLFATVGMAITGVTFVLLVVLPVDFSYWAFAAVIALNGLGSGMFASPNTAEVMSAVPAVTARCRLRYARHAAQRRYGVVDRRVLLADDRRPVQFAAGRDELRSTGAGCARRRGAQYLRTAAGRQLVRGLPGRESDRSATRPDRRPRPRGRAQGRAHRTGVLPALDFRAVPLGSGRGLPGSRDYDADRRGGLVVRGQSEGENRGRRTQ